MNNSTTQKSGLKVRSQSSNQTYRWEHIRVQHLRHPAGECACHYPDEHTLSLSLAPRPVRLLQIQRDKTFTGLYGKGDISITPAKTSFFARWDSEDQLLQIQLTDQFIRSVTREALDQEFDQLELLPEFQVRNPQIEAIGMLLLAELHQAHAENNLYIESLSNILAVNLVRHYAATKPKIPTYNGGLPQRQLMQVLDYVDAHLDQEIKLADLAQLLDISQFHFSHLFQQSLGISPYQYVIQQRIERAKQLLKNTDQSIIDIALTCGFSSHSHLSKKFRQVTGMTPKNYRAH